jgi:hypothetical protein
MMRYVCSVFSALLLASMCAAQMPAPPKPSPEIKRLSYFTGTWKVDGKMEPGPGMPQGGPMSSTDKAGWDFRGFYLVTRSEFTGGMGKEVSYMGYDPQKKQYTFDAFNSMGQSDHATGTVSGKTWTWKSETMMEGKTMAMRGTVTEDLPTQYTIKFESSNDGGKTWAPSFEATATKQTAAATAPAAKKPAAQ